jgi:hypothetical protein
VIAGRPRRRAPADSPPHAEPDIRPVRPPHPYPFAAPRRGRAAVPSRRWRPSLSVFFTGRPGAPNRSAAAGERGPNFDRIGRRIAATVGAERPKTAVPSAAATLRPPQTPGRTREIRVSRHTVVNFYDTRPAPPATRRTAQFSGSDEAGVAYISRPAGRVPAAIAGKAVEILYSFPGIAPADGL